MSLKEVFPISITLALITFWGFMGVGWIVTSDQRTKEDKRFLLQCLAGTALILFMLGLFS